MPYGPSSRPKPERLTPPNGNSAPSRRTPFTKTMPASMSLATRVALLGVGREDVRTEAERRVVGDPDRLLVGRDPVNARDGPEELLPVGVALRADTGEDRRAEEVALPVAVENGLGALGLRAVDLVLKPLGRCRRREWPHRRILGRIPGLHF